MNASLWQGTSDQLPRTAFVWHRSFLLSNMCSNMCRMIRTYACETLWITLMKRMACLRRPGTPSATWVSLRYYAPPSWIPPSILIESKIIVITSWSLPWIDVLDLRNSGFQLLKMNWIQMNAFLWQGTSDHQHPRAVFVFRCEAPMYFVWATCVATCETLNIFDET